MKSVLITKEISKVRVFSTVQKKKRKGRRIGRSTEERIKEGRERRRKEK